MGSIAVLDTNVLLPAPLRDTLLRLAEADLYVPKWSDRILAELTLAALRAVSDQAAALTKPPLTAHQVLDYIALDAPEFARQIRGGLSSDQ